MMTTGYETTSPVDWHRIFSAFNDKITFPKGTPVTNDGGKFYISPSAMEPGTIERHDLTYYGCEVPENKVRRIP